ncbi:exported hypothetical protein [Frankia sp. Hr75.2]|nr:exported hypothetical protein [Frankia sp. Hr75.2]
MRGRLRLFFIALMGALALFIASDTARAMQNTTPSGCPGAGGTVSGNVGSILGGSEVRLTLDSYAMGDIVKIPIGSGKVSPNGDYRVSYKIPGTLNLIQFKPGESYEIRAKFITPQGLEGLTVESTNFYINENC